MLSLLSHLWHVNFLGGRWQPAWSTAFNFNAKVAIGMGQVSIVPNLVRLVGVVWVGS